jgi:hypothetical protein
LRNDKVVNEVFKALGALENIGARFHGSLLDADSSVTV